MWAISRLLVIVLSVLFLTGRLSAQEGKKKADAGAPKQNEKQPDAPFDELRDFWLKDAGVGTEAWVACLGQSYPTGGPLGLLAARNLLSDPEKGLPDWKFVFDECLPLWHRYLELIRDNRPMPSVERMELKELSPPDWGMYLAWVQAVDRSHLATLDMFKKSAAANEHVGYRQLKLKPGQYRGQIVTITGRISRVEKEEAARHRQTDIQFVYFTEIYGEFKGEPPYAVIFTELPASVPIRKKIDMEVTFHGYFLGHVLFADPKKKERDVIAPYLVGKTLIVNRVTPVAAETESYSYYLITSVVGGIVCVVILAVLLHFWFRRGDHRIAAHLAQVRDKHRPFSLEPAEPEAPLADPVPPADNGPPAAP